MGGSEEAAVLWEFDEAAPAVLCWACAKTRHRLMAGYKERSYTNQILNTYLFVISNAIKIIAGTDLNLT